MTPRLLLVLLAAAAALTTAAADTFTVTNTADSGVGSLRMAITDANAHVNVGPPDVIAFAIPGAGVKTIAPATPLPALSDPVLIDGYTQAGTSENTLAIGHNAVLRIELNGANTSGLAIGIDLAGGQSTVRGLIINRFGASSLSFFGSGGIRLSSSDNVVTGNFIGSDATGTIGLGNVGFGVTVDVGAGNVVGGPAPADRNIFAGAATESAVGGFTGIQIRTTLGGTRVEGNYIGTNASGSTALGNFRGIDLIGSPAADVTIGGLTSTPGIGVGNVISGNSSNGGINNDGIYISNRPGNLTIQGNLIGLDATGTFALPNGVSGINFQDATPGASTLLIGGTVAGARNVIFSNRIRGIVATHSASRFKETSLAPTLPARFNCPAAAGSAFRSVEWSRSAGSASRPATLSLALGWVCAFLAAPSLCRGTILVWGRMAPPRWVARLLSAWRGTRLAASAGP